MVLILQEEMKVWKESRDFCNSVFEGEVTESGYAKIKAEIKEIINEKKDSIIIYTFDSKNYTSREVLGYEKNTTDSFI